MQSIPFSVSSQGYTPIADASEGTRRVVHSFDVNYVDGQRFTFGSGQDAIGPQLGHPETGGNHNKCFDAAGHFRTDPGMPLGIILTENGDVRGWVVVSETDVDAGA